MNARNQEDQGGGFSVTVKNIRENEVQGPRYKNPKIEKIYTDNKKTLEDATNLSAWEKFLADLKWAVSS